MFPRRTPLQGPLSAPFPAKHERPCRPSTRQGKPWSQPGAIELPQNCGRPSSSRPLPMRAPLQGPLSAPCQAKQERPCRPSTRQGPLSAPCQAKHELPWWPSTRQGSLGVRQTHRTLSRQAARATGSQPRNAATEPPIDRPRCLSTSRVKAGKKRSTAAEGPKTAPSPSKDGWFSVDEA